jgi:aryl-phospho-beta-D-glucosidase BglC (GH1 family)
VQGIAFSRLSHLKRGINLSHWFSQSTTGDYSENHLQTYNTERDIRIIREMGFDYVRFPIEPAPLLDEEDPSKLKLEYLRRVDSALDMILANGLNVVVDLHPSDAFKIKLRTDDKQVTTLIRFWRALADHLSTRDPDRVFFEILNEPMVEDSYRWMGIQAKFAAAIREAAPRHTIIATGARWSSIDELLKIEPLSDRNVIYNFHFYEPHTFTHQGATWGAEYWPYIKGVHYPSSPESVSNALNSIEQQSAREALKDYGEKQWNAGHVEELIARAAEWARKHNVPLMCDEFGVYRAYAPGADRLRWIEDVRAALERHGIAWAMWDYAGGFGVVERREGTAVPDLATLAALGMQPVRQQGSGRGVGAPR